jgi:lysylphosphatidylglycerol synthetase-like protein (DUF2156 family)
MFDFLALVLGFFLVCILILIILVGIKFFCNLASVGKSKNSYNEETGKQVIEDSKEDSEADLAMTTDDEDSCMFPPEFGDNEDS